MQVQGAERAAVGAAAGGSNLAAWVRKHAETVPHSPALAQAAAGAAPEPGLTWVELDRLLDDVAAGLGAEGLVAGQRVALVGSNTVAFVVAYLAALRAGLVVVPLDPKGDPAQLLRAVQQTRARLVLAEHPIDVGVPVRPLSQPGLADLAAQGAAVAVGAPADPEALAVLLFTAGTSDSPRAAMLSHRALHANVLGLRQLEAVPPDGVVLGVVPLFHAFGLCTVLNGWLGSGARLVLLDRPSALVSTLIDEQVTELAVTPPLLAQLAADDRCQLASRSLRSVLCGGAPPEALSLVTFSARTGLRVEHGYGATECSAGISTTFGGPLFGAAHVGRPLAGVSVRIGDGSEPSEPGEVLVSGANLFSGYWPDGAGGPGPTGWFATGDVGYQDGAELFLVDRAQDVVHVGGFAVYPAEVEAAIRELDGVTVAAVVGRDGGPPETRLVAFATGSITAEEVQAHCARRLPKYKRPGTIRVVAELPKGPAGKVQKARLREAIEPTGGTADGGHG